MLRAAAQILHAENVIDLLHARNIKVIVEIDDDFHTAHSNNKAFMLNHPRVNALQNWNYLGACVRLADLVTVSTDALANRYGSHGRVGGLAGATASTTTGSR